jgi:hypothetical protein
MLGESTNRQYLTIGYGRVRRKCDKDNPKAVERETKKGEKTYAIEYTFIQGALERIYYKESKEYGNKWDVLMKDGKDNYCLQIPEQSREAGDLMKRIPNLVIGQVYKFTPYDMKDEKDPAKHKRGLSIKDVGGTVIESYFQKYEKNGEGWKVTNLHGFPEPEKPTKDMDSDDWKVHFIKVNKFLRENALKFLANLTTEPQEKTETADDIPDPSNADFQGSDLPF